MIFSRAILGQELILVGTIGLAMGLIYTYLRQRGQLDLLGRAWLPALLWAIFGSLDALVTIVGTWGDPWHEANPIVRSFLLWNGWVGQVIYTFFYVLFWAAIVIGLEALLRRLGGVWTSLLGALQLLILYRLALEHCYGFFSWTPAFPSISQFIAFFEAHAPWLFSDSVVGYFLDLGTALAACCVVLQLSIATFLRGMGLQAPVASHAQARAAGPGQITEH
jgi:hypothetical protein